MKIVQNDLYDYNMKIWQIEEGFKFSLDSLLLAEFVKAKNEDQIIIDFCTGNASVPLVLSSKYQNKIYGFEIQEEIYNLAISSIKDNKKEEQIKIINDNVLNILSYFKEESIDIVTCNPPYFKYQKDSIINDNKIKSIARHEIEINLEEIIKMASTILKNKGSFYLIHRSERLEEISNMLNKYNLHLKKLVPIYTTNNKNSQMVLIQAVKNGKIGLKILPAIYTDKLKTFKNLF